MTQQTDLGNTAHWTAAVRARERARADRLVDDPWAEALAGEVGAKWLADHPEQTTVPIIIRTRFFDEFLERASTEVQQVVLLGAGLDTRAYRLRWPPGTTVYELEQPQVLHHKDEVLQAAGAEPSCSRRAVAADLTEPWEELLIGSGFDRELPSAWLLEGFLFYLSGTHVLDLIDRVGALAAPRSLMGFDIINGAMLTSEWTRAWIEMQARSGAPWIGTMDDPEQTLAERGWRATLTQAGAPDAHHGRWELPVLPVKAPGVPHNWFVVAEKIT